MRTLATLLGAACLVGWLGVDAHAADYFESTKLFLMKDPGPEEAKKIVWKIKTRDVDDDTVVEGDPVAHGATLRIVLGASAHCSAPPCEGGGDQCFVLPASGWSRISSIGFKYKDRTFANGPVKLASVKETPSGNFLLKAALHGPGIDLYLEDELGLYAAILAFDGGGGGYGSGSGGATPKPNDSRTFRVKNETGTLSYPPRCSPSGAFLD